MIAPLTMGEHFFKNCFYEMLKVAQGLMDHVDVLDHMVAEIRRSRDEGGRLFFCGVGGGAGNGTHAAADLFKSCSVKAICLTDNVPTVTAITNDEGWSEVFLSQLVCWDLNSKDLLFVLSVGGGDEVRNISSNIVKAVRLAKGMGAKVIGIVGREEGFTAKNGDIVVVVPVANKAHLTTHTEGMQAYILHFITEFLRLREAKWESQKS